MGDRGPTPDKARTSGAIIWGLTAVRELDPPSFTFLSRRKDQVDRRFAVLNANGTR